MPGWWKWLAGAGAIAGLVVLVSLNFPTPWAGNPSAISQTDCEAEGTFVLIPDGTFLAGSDERERAYGYRISAEAIADTTAAIARAETNLRNQGWFDREAPRQEQALPDFCIGRNLITNAEYQAFVAATGHRSPGISEREYQKQGFLVHPYEEVKPYLWQDGTYPAGEARHPVVLVSYEDALAFAAWKGGQDGFAYRLPAALEWEKAARGTDGRYFPWGDRWHPDATNAMPSGLWHTSEVATFSLSRSIYGVEDMAGNVFEYTSTLKSEGEETVAVMKGCSWDDLPGFCRAAYQHTRPTPSRHILFGFRLVRERG